MTNTSRPFFHLCKGLDITVPKCKNEWCALILNCGDSQSCPHSGDQPKQWITNPCKCKTNLLSQLIIYAWMYITPTWMPFNYWRCRFLEGQGRSVSGNSAHRGGTNRTKQNNSSTTMITSHQSDVLQSTISCCQNKSSGGRVCGQ